MQDIVFLWISLNNILEFFTAELLIIIYYIKGNGIGLQGLSSNQIYMIIVPLPPFNMQKQIVKRINNLFKCLDKIETDINMWYLKFLGKESLQLKAVKVQQKNFLENVISNADYDFLKKQLKKAAIWNGILSYGI